MRPPCNGHQFRSIIRLPCQGATRHCLGPRVPSRCCCFMFALPFAIMFACVINGVILTNQPAVVGLTCQFGFETKCGKRTLKSFSGFICSFSWVHLTYSTWKHIENIVSTKKGSKSEQSPRRPEKIGEEDGDKRTHGHQGTIQTHDYAIQINPGTQAMQRKIITRQRRRTSKTKKRRERLWQFACFAIAGPICSRSDFELKTLWPRILVPVSNSIAFDMGFWLNWNTWKMCSPCVCLSNQLIWAKWKQKAGVEEEEENVLHFSRDYCVLGPEKGEEGKISAHFRGSIGVF